MNIERLNETFKTINQFGATNEGMNRLAYTASEREALHYLINIFKQENMKVILDAAGNVIARREGTDPALPAVACGSHIDTVYNGGEYDGTIGVLTGLEVVRTLNEAKIETKHPIEVIVFACEESARFGVSTIGSKAMTGLLDKSKLGALKDKDGISIIDAFKACSLNVNDINLAKREKDELKVFYEVHIEQGPVLENKQKQIGIVTGIAAPTRFEVKINGLASHSGSTPMNLRKDAFLAAAEIGLELEGMACLEAENETVATVGDCVVSPGAMNVIPGKAEVIIDIRSTSIQSKEKIMNELYQLIYEVEKKRGVTINVTKLSNEKPISMDKTVINSIQDTCKQLGISNEKMPSGAGHDAMNIASLYPSGLIFIPSKDGLSHNLEEYTALDQINDGATILKEEMLKAACRVN